MGIVIEIIKWGVIILGGSVISCWTTPSTEDMINELMPTLMKSMVIISGGMTILILLVVAGIKKLFSVGERELKPMKLSAEKTRVMLLPGENCEEVEVSSVRRGAIRTDGTRR